MYIKYGKLNKVTHSCSSSAVIGQLIIYYMYIKYGKPNKVTHSCSSSAVIGQSIKIQLSKINAQIHAIQ